MKRLPDPVVRVLRRLGRVKHFGLPSAFAEDHLEQLAFWADYPDRRAAHRDFLGLRTVKEYFDFSSQFFGAHQIESEISGLLRWAAESQPRIVCEIGTAHGGTTFLLGQSLPGVERLFGIDLYVRRKRRLKYFSRADQHLSFFQGSSYAPETVRRFRSQLGDRKLDLLFIDGDHTFAGVASDFAMYRHFVKDGGIVVFHDIVEDFTTRYGRKTGRWAGEVPRFWREIKSYYRTREFVESPEQDGLGIGAIIYDASVTLPHLI
jgi:predicted O-methyltransferase YrrM